MTQSHLSRRQLMARGAGAGLIFAVAPTLLTSCGSDSGSGKAAASDTVRFFGADASSLEDWSDFTDSTGLKIDWVAAEVDPSTFVQKVVKGGVADEFQIVTVEGGVQELLAPEGYLIPVDTSRIEGWDEIPESIRNLPQLQYEGKPFGVPGTYNADSFAFYTDEGFGEVDSWSLVFDDERTLGKVALEDNWLTTLPSAAMYLSHHDLAKIADPSNMTPEEAKTAADFLIERKKAGQFRALWSSWEESLNMLSNKEVSVMSCWEPAARELQTQGVPVEYASPKEGFSKWVYVMYITRGAEESGMLDAVYDAFNYMTQGYYGAHIADLRGYVPARPDLALEYAQSNEAEFSADSVQYISDKFSGIEEKLDSKFYWQNTLPENREAIIGEWERFKKS